MPAESGRALAHRVLRQVAAQQVFVTPVLGAALDASGLPARERRLATELVYGVCRHQQRLDRALAAMAHRGLRKLNPGVLAILRVGAYELLFLDRIPDHAAVNSAVDAARRVGGPRLAGFVNGVLRRLAREGEPALPPHADRRAHLAAALSLPGWIVDRLAGELAAEAGQAADAAGLADALEAAATALNGPAALSVRANRLRCDREALAACLRGEGGDMQSDIEADTDAGGAGVDVEPSPWAPQALMVSGLGDPERSPSFAQGLWTVQDVGAQLVGHMVAPAPGWRILDACAGVGGKSTHLAELTGDQAVIDAADVSESKLALCGQSAARLGLRGVVPRRVDLTRTDPEAWAAAGLAPGYDAVLLDAPCSGLGVLRRHPEAKARLAEQDVARMAALQARLLDALAPRVQPGGILVYSVCTFTREEGPAQVEAFLARHPGFALEAPPAGEVAWARLAPGAAGEGAAAGGVVRTWPHLHEADGFFMARMRRRT